jgi:hypothetical protein
MKRDKLAENTSVSSKVSDYFSKKPMGEMERNLAADEATFAYHVCMHNQSFRFDGLHVENNPETI